MPFISVIIPAYNRSSTIDKVIKSVLDQTYKDFELLIVDDGSTDNTLKYVEMFLYDSRIKVYTQHNQGVSVARNSGIERATGEYVVFLDSDDYVEQDWLSDFYKLILSGFEIGCCGYKIFDGHTFIVKMPRKLSSLFYNYTASFLAGTFVVKKEVLDKVGYYDASLSFSENSELGMRLTSFCFINRIEIGVINVANLTIVQDQDRVNRYSRKKLYSNIKLLKKYKELFAKNPKDHLDYLSISGVEAMRLGRYKTARVFIMRYCKIDPANMKNILRYMASFSPVLVKLLYKK